MKKSRLNLFKSTSMLISVLGVIMIVATIIVAAYIGFSSVSSNLTGGISSGTQYDQLAALKSNYSDLESQFNSTKQEVYSTDNSTHQQKYVDAQVYLIRASNALNDVDSALSMDKSSTEVDERLDNAQTALNTAHEAYNNLTGNSTSK